MSRARSVLGIGLLVLVGSTSGGCSAGPRVTTPPGDAKSGPAMLGGAPLREGESCGNVTSALDSAHDDVKTHQSYGAPPALDVGPIVDVAVGEYAACAVSKKGDVVCWNGEPRFMGIASEERSPMPEPRLRPGLADVVEVGVGRSHACARLRSGAVACWGEGYRGQLGTSSISRSREVPPGEEANVFPVARIQDAVKLAVGTSHACAALKDGSVWCWGESYSGEAGVAADAVYTPAQVAGISGAVDVVAGAAVTCARTRVGKVFCWGQHRDVERDPAPRPIEVPAATAIVAGGGAACALVQGGAELACWGTVYNLARDVDGDVLALKLPKKAKRVALSGDGVCAAWEDGTIGCHGDIATSLTGKRDAGWVEVAGVRDAAALSFGDRAVCAVDAAGGVSCFGDRHQLGRFTPDHTGVVDVAGVDGATDLVVAESSACVLDGERAARCWGASRSSPNAPGLFAAITGAADALALGPEACALTGGKLRCTQPPEGDAQPSPLGVAFTLPAPATSVVGTRGHACVRTSDGGVYCWGASSSGQLGYDSGEDAEPVETPTRVPGVAGAVSVAVGECSTCAILGDGGVSCWGCNDAGVLGTGVFAERGAPAAVLGVKAAKKVAIGGRLACALVDGGAVRCWGNGAFASVPWPALDGVLDVDVSGDEACLVLADGTVRCGVPGCAVDVPGIHDATRIGVGYNRACALRAGGRVSCWGYRNEGALGDGELDFARVPVRVLPRPAP